MTDLIGFLKEQGCFETKHSGLTLGDHLVNTYLILKSVDAPEEVALAGGLHSIYGTNAFKTQTILDRSLLASTFGSKVERWVWLFGSIKRPHALETLPDEGGRLQDRRTGEVIYLDDQDLEALRLIEAANLLEQSSDLSKYPKICASISDRLTGQDDHGGAGRL